MFGQTLHTIDLFYTLFCLIPPLLLPDPPSLIIPSPLLLHNPLALIIPSNICRVPLKYPQPSRSCLPLLISYKLQVTLPKALQWPISQ